MEMTTISLPSELWNNVDAQLQELGLSLTEYLEENFKKKTTPTEKNITIAQLFENYTDDYKGEPYDWGSPVGEEALNECEDILKNPDNYPVFHSIDELIRDLESD